MNASATEDNGQVIAKIGCDNIQMTAQQAQMLGEQLIEAAHLARNGCRRRALRSNGKMSEEYAPPDHVMASWRRQCNCCPICSQHPCDGVMAGGMCDESCDCDDEDDFDGPEDDCYLGPDGFCGAAGSEHCEWDCPNR